MKRPKKANYKLPKYSWGGDIWKGIKDVSRSGADFMLSSTLIPGAQDVIKKSDYETNIGKNFNPTNAVGDTQRMFWDSSANSIGWKKAVTPDSYETNIGSKLAKNSDKNGKWGGKIAAAAIGTYFGNAAGGLQAYNAMSQLQDKVDNTPGSGGSYDQQLADQQAAQTEQERLAEEQALQSKMSTRQRTQTGYLQGMQTPNTPIFCKGGNTKKPMKKYPGGGTLEDMANTPTIGTGINAPMAEKYLAGRGDSMIGALQAEAYRRSNEGTWKGSKNYWTDLGKFMSTIPKGDLRGQEEYDNLINTYPNVADATTKYGYLPNKNRGFSVNPPVTSNDSIITQSKYPERYKQLTTKQYAKGGYSVDNRGFANSELEDEEVFRTPQGNMEQVTGATHAQGGEAMNLPQGTEILGKNIVPGTDKSYKEYGDKLMKDYKKFTKILENKPTGLAKRSATMMLSKVHEGFNTLMISQESNKPQEEQTQQFAKGGTKWDITNYDKYLGQSPNFYSTQYTTDLNVGEDPNIVTASTPGLSNAGTNKYSTEQRSFNGGANIGQIMDYAPIVYNLAQGLFNKPKTLNPADYYNKVQYNNPQEETAYNMMSQRRYNVNPEIESNRLQQSTYLHNLRQAAPTQAQYMGGLQAGSTSRQRADAEAYARKQNMDNAYIGDEAQMRANMGQTKGQMRSQEGAQRAATDYAVEDVNARRTAAQKNYTSTALTQLQQVNQTNRLMKNLKGTDEEKMEIWDAMFGGYGFAKKMRKGK